ncbi:hypothetical protein V5799_026013 [Amblyomma americanum]|uniref:Nlr family card domain protein n=1 Tax=Amblyomma americanum TaxID=6943 RepID=A0AAQ4DJS6_AMBAM
MTQRLFLAGQMARRRDPSPDPLSSNPTATLHTCRICLGCVGGYTAPFTGEVFDCTLPCTGSKHRACQIIHHLSAWNDALLQGRYELRERARTRPELKLAFLAPFAALNDLEKLLKVATLLYILIKKHHCLTAVDVDIGRLNVYDALLCDALRDNEHIQSVTLLDYTPNRDAFKPFFSVIPSLKNLRHFQYTSDAEFRRADMRALESTLEKTNALESLHIPGLPNYMDSTGLLTAIARYASLRELTLSFSFLEQASDDCGDEFSEYVKNSDTLTTLSLEGDCDFRDACGKRFLRAVRDNESILSLILDEIFVDNEALDLMASVFAKNTVLRRFHIHPVYKCFIDGGGHCDSWLPSLTRNDTIEEITLPFQIWRPPQWLEFFEVLSLKQRLKTIAIGCAEMSVSDLNEFCMLICQSGAEERVTFNPPFDLSLYDNNFSLIRCKSFVDIVADCEDNAAQLQKLTAEVSAVSHVTSLTLSISPLPTEVDPLSPIASLIGATTTFKTLRLFVTATDKAANYTNLSWTATIESLSRNRSISNLHLDLNIIKAEDIEKLANVIRCSDNITMLGVTVEERMSDLFPKHLSRGIASNYTLLSVQFLDHSDPNAFAVTDTTRRNCGLVARASQFRMGARLERTTVCAMERVFRHRALLKEFAQVECISVEKAAAELRVALCAFDDMRSFMVMAGVVRVSVVCHAREDMQTQLDDLNEPCWRVLRRYLFLDHVVTKVPPEFLPQ